VIREQTRGPGLLATDATGIPVLDPKTTEGIRLGTIWCWTNARWITFEYSAKGDSDSVRRFLGEELARTVQCDGTNITTFIEGAGGKRPGCWSHARRRLAEAARAGDQIALEGLRIIAGIFAVERAATLAGDSAEERRARRDEHTRPILDELRAWIDEHRAIVPPKTPLGQGLGYLHRQWQRLLLFLEDGNIEATSRVGDRRGGVQASLGCLRRFQLRARVGCAIAPSPVPATSNRTGGFPASGSPRGCHRVGVMGPFRSAMLSRGRDGGGPGSHRRDPRCRTRPRYSTSSNRSPFAFAS
jgi:hypothetical protein